MTTIIQQELSFNLIHRIVYHKYQHVSYSCWEVHLSAMLEEQVNEVSPSIITNIPERMIAILQ